MNENWTALFAEAETVHCRLARLEKRLATRHTGNARLGLGLVLLGMAAVASRDQPLTFADAQPGPGKPLEEIVCASLQVVGADGKVRVSLGSDQISGYV